MSYHIIRSELSARAAGGLKLPKSSDFCHVGTAQLDNWRWKVRNFTIPPSLALLLQSISPIHSLSLTLAVKLKCPLDLVPFFLASFCDLWAFFLFFFKVHITLKNHSFCNLYNAQRLSLSLTLSDLKNKRKKRHTRQTAPMHKIQQLQHIEEEKRWFPLWKRSNERNRFGWRVRFTLKSRWYGCCTDLSDHN